MKQSSTHHSMQNWMGYNLMLECGWKLLPYQRSGRNTEERTKSKTTTSACILALSALFRDALIISCTQFCRADQALSNGIWLHLSSDMAWRKNTERTGGVFLEIFVSSFVRISDHLTFPAQQKIFRPWYSGLIYAMGRANFLRDRIQNPSTCMFVLYLVFSWNVF